MSCGAIARRHDVLEIRDDTLLYRTACSSAGPRDSGFHPVSAAIPIERAGLRRRLEAAANAFEVVADAIALPESLHCSFASNQRDADDTGEKRPAFLNPLICM